jgi:alpha-glucosidase
MINSMGLAGIPFAGSDVGGFAGSTTPQLFARWISIGAFTPFFRVHKMINAPSSEPWSYGEEVEEISRNYISLRYRLMPYIYTLFYQASLTGIPVNRSLAINYSNDSNIYSHEFHNQFLLGDYLLVCPVASNERLVKIYLPNGNWYELYTDKKYTGGETYIIEAPLDRLPVFVKQGAILPLQSLTQSTVQKPSEILELHVYPGDGAFDLYEDDGTTHSRHHSIIAFSKTDEELPNLKWKVKSQSYTSAFKKLRILFHGYSNLQQVFINNKKRQVKKTTYRFLDPLSNFDPFYGDREGKDSSELFYLEVPLK